MRNRANKVFLHPEDYSILKTIEAKKSNTVTWINDLADPLHFGNWGGLITKIIYFIGGMAISALILTGIWIFVKRNAKKRIKKKTHIFWKVTNWAIVLVMNLFMFGGIKKVHLASTKFMVILAITEIIVLYFTWYLFVYKTKKASKD